MIESLALPGPIMTGTTPASPANNNGPLVRGTATPGTMVNIYKTAGCTGPVAATGTAAAFASPGIPVSVPDNSTTSFFATAVDMSGGESTCSTAPVVYIEDSTPPSPPNITLEPASPGSDETPSWTFSVEAGSTAECELSSGGVPLYTYTSCTSPQTYDLTAEPDGTYVFSVRARDLAGNQGAASTDSFVLDSTIPVAPVITVSPPTPSSDDQPTWEFTLEPGSSAECELSYEGTVVDPFGLCNSPHSYNLNPADPDGNYTFRVQARDAANNPSAPVSSNYTYDTTPPSPPSIGGGGPPSPGNSTSPSWTFTIDPGSTAECELRRGGVVVSAWQPCSSPEAHDLSGEPDGDYDFSVRAVDTAGNTGASLTSTYTLDTTGPDVNITSEPTTPGSDPNPSWSFSTEPGASVECELSVGGSVVNPWTSCSSPQEYDLSAQSDGAYRFTVRATDAAGNTGNPSSDVYILDTSPPVVSITSAPAAFSSEQNPEWAFTSEAGVTTECELSSVSGGVLQSFTFCVSPQSYDLTSLPDDTYTFSVQATDQAGNLGPASTSAYTLDTSGPVASVSSSPPSPGNSLSPSWGFTGEAGATLECELTGPSGVLSTWTPCASPQAYNLTGQPEGGYTFSVRATDAAGNVGAPASNTYTLDRTAPASSITSAPASPGNTTDPIWTFTTELGATTQCELSRSGVVVSAWAGCTSPKTYSLAGQPDGTYTFRVRATDTAGNTGTAQSSAYALDTTGPNVSLNGPASPGNGRNLSWSFSSEAGASTECELSTGALVLQPFAPCTSPATSDLTVQPDGTYTLRVRATDPSGNTGPAASAGYVLDTTGPDASIVNAPATPGSVTNLSWAFTAEAGASMECELAGPTGVLQAYAACSSPEGFDITGGTDGAYTFSVRATDDAGNTGTPAASTYILDSTAPAVPVITASPNSPGRDASVSWAFTAEAGATTECELRTTTNTVHAFGPCVGSQPESLSSDGDYTFAVRAVDALGNASAAATSGYTLDTTGPGITFTSEPKSPDADKNPTWSFSAEAGASTGCSLSSGGTELYADATCPSPVSFNLGGQPDGTYTVRVSGIDQAGNEGPPASSKYVLDTIEEEPDPPAEPAPKPAQPSNGPEPDAAPAPEKDPVRRVAPAEEPADEPDEVIPEPDEAREVSESTPRTKGAFGEFLENVGTVAAGLLEQPAFPLSLISVVIGFLVLQNRMDRRDPKLALAPVYPDPHLYFDPQDGPGKDR
jgi:predicted phage tail protein